MICRCPGSPLVVVVRQFDATIVAGRERRSHELPGSIAQLRAGQQTHWQSLTRTRILSSCLAANSQSTPTDNNSGNGNSGNNNNDNNSSNNSSADGVGSIQVFVFIAFGVITLAQLVFLERRIYRLRAERWVHVHGPNLPMHARGGRHQSIGIAPWTRPPLPTYAAALAQSGVRTGDVEDNVIAILPPPAYGHTRGSKLLMAGLMSDAQRQERAQARARVIAQANAQGGGRASMRFSLQSVEMESRPMSYVSRDEEWEERQDAMRAVRLEATLARMETAHVRN